MQRTALESLGLLAVLLCVASTIRAALRHRHNTAVKVPRAAVEAEKPLVRILDTREDLENAVRRAAEFERRMAVVLEARATRYESLLTRPATVTQIPIDSRGRTGAFSPDEQGSA